ncbi:MAG: Fic family protein [Gammaproteobacteria bacterium]|nr:Fic family protein [Gammaproteobacteria bacterium]
MRRSDLHPRLQKTARPIPGRSGQFAVLPEPPPHFFDLPRQSLRFSQAEQALGALRQALRDYPQRDLLMSMLNRREAADSSQIEGMQTGFEALLVYETQVEQEREDEDARQTLAYVQAYTAGCAAIRDGGPQALNSTLLNQLHGILMAGQERKRPGQWRDQQNWIGGLTLETARFIPPPPDTLAEHMAALDKLLYYVPEDVRVPTLLARAAIVHPQFEAIHPYMDGNGRLGRLLLPLMFLAEDEPPIHLATYLKLRHQDYYDALLQVQMRLDWEPWVQLFLECVIASCQHTLAIIDRLRAIHAEWERRIAHLRRHAGARRIVTELLSERPTVTVRQAEQQLGLSFQAANKAMATLVDLGILAAPAQQRHRVFRAVEILGVMYEGLENVWERRR